PARLRYRCPVHQRIHLRPSRCGVQNRHSSAAGMPEQPEFPFDPLHSPRVILEQLEIFQIPRESVSLEGVGLGERLTIPAHSAAGKIEGYRGESGTGQRTREIWEESPVREPLEPVTDDDRPLRGFTGEYLPA